MCWHELILEERGGYLYHSTQPDVAAAIIFTQTIEPKTTHNSYHLGYRHGYYLPGMRKEFSGNSFTPGVSLTRSLNFARQWRSGFNAVFVLDQAKLARAYKIVPFNWFKGNPDTNTLSSHHRSESEEFVITTKGIAPLDRYLVEILISKDTFDACAHVNSDYVDPHDVEDTPYAALLDHPKLKVI